MNPEDTIAASATLAPGVEPHRKTRSDATPLEPHRETILAWIETEKCSYQECCNRLKEQFGIDCSPKVLCTHRQQWATESELEASVEMLEKSLRLTGQGLENLEARAGDFRRLLPLILQARLINAAMNPATTDQALERLARMLHRFESLALRREEIALRREIEANRSVALRQSRQEPSKSPEPSNHPPEGTTSSPDGTRSSSHSAPLNLPTAPDRAVSPIPIPSQNPQSTPPIVRSLTRAERKARIEAAKSHYR
jgi:hypothetical protein